jgi:hypothetical protein
VTFWNYQMFTNETSNKKQEVYIEELFKSE